jgi:conjugative relaxase-like TrwC/TraI family protein
VLGLHGVRLDRADYYLSDLARELPVAGGGRWAGAAAAGLGLQGPVRPDDFRRLLESRHPRTGAALGSGRTSVAAFDLTFSAPKSASVLFALGGPEVARTVAETHGAAVAGSLSYLEAHGVTAARRAGPARFVVPTTGAAAAVFTHAVSRNGDPHLHSHVVLANLVHGADGRWSACDRRGLQAHRVAAAAVYGAHLRAGLASALGVRWTSDPGRTAEIAGVGPELMGEFSSRRADIRRHVYEQGARSARGARIAWAVTRPAKAPGAPFTEAARSWERRALATAGGSLDLPLGPGRPSGRPAVLDEHRFAAAISLTAHGGARRRDVVAAFGAAARDGVVASGIERLVAQWVPPGPVGVDEPLHQRRSVVPANRHLRTLGPRPVDPDHHAEWVDAARALDAYRDRWGQAHTAEPGAPAPSPSSLASLPASRLADHVRTGRRVAAARARLGWRAPVTAERVLGR